MFRKILLTIGFIAALLYIFFMGMAIYEHFFGDSKYEELIGQVEKYKQINKNVAELEVKYEEQKKLNDELKAKFKEVELKNDERVKIIQQADFVLSKKRRTTDNADLIYIDKLGKQKYIYHELHLVSDDGSIGPPIGYVMIFEDGKVVSKIYKHQIEVNSATIKDEKTGRYKIVNKANFILEQSGLANRKDSSKKDWKNVKYPINIVSGTSLVNPIEKVEAKKIRFVDPHLDLGINNSFSKQAEFSVVPNVGISLSSYGRSKRDNSFRFFRFGVGYSSSKKIEATFSPIMYNIAGTIPILTNTYIYPNIGFSQTQKMTLGLGLSASF